MTLSQLEEKLAVLRKEHGDIPVVWESISRKWPPDPAVRGEGPQKHVVLNS